MQPGRSGIPEPVQRVGQPQLEGRLKPHVTGSPGQVDGLLTGLERIVWPSRVLLDPGRLAQRPRLGRRIAEPAAKPAAAARQFRSASP